MIMKPNATITVVNTPGLPRVVIFRYGLDGRDLAESWGGAEHAAWEAEHAAWEAEHLAELAEAEHAKDTAERLAGPCEVCTAPGPLTIDGSDAVCGACLELTITVAHSWVSDLEQPETGQPLNYF